MLERLECGSFADPARWCAAEAPSVAVSAAQMHALLEDIDVRFARYRRGQGNRPDRRYGSYHAGLSSETSLTRSEAEAMIAPLREALVQKDAAPEEAKRTIRTLLHHLHGTRSERSALVLTAEGQRLIDAQWLQVQQEKPADQPTQQDQDS